MKTMIAIFLLMMLPIVAGPKTESYSGTVLTVDEDYCGKSADYLLRMVVVTAPNVNVTLVLAPKWYLHTRKIELRPGDKVEVKAIKSDEGTTDVISVKIGQKTHLLRDPKGRPLWKPETGSEDLIKTICKA